MQQLNQLLVPAINVNDSVTKSKFDNLYGCRHSLVDGLNRALDVMIGGKVAVICGYGDVGKGCAQSLRGQGARVVITEIDPINALQAAMEGYEVTHNRRHARPRRHFTSAQTGNVDIITLEHMEGMKTRPSFATSAISTTRFRSVRSTHEKDIKRTNIKPQVDKYTFPDDHEIFMLAEGRLVNLGCATVTRASSCRTRSRTRCWLNSTFGRTRTLTKSASMFSRNKLDEEVARLHLQKIGVKLTTLTKKQADYLGVPIEGPYKSEHYRY